MVSCGSSTAGPLGQARAVSGEASGGVQPSGLSTSAGMTTSSMCPWSSSSSMWSWSSSSCPWSSSSSMWSWSSSSSSWSSSSCPWSSSSWSSAGGGAGSSAGAGGGGSGAAGSAAGGAGAGAAVSSSSPAHAAATSDMASISDRSRQIVRFRMVISPLLRPVGRSPCIKRKFGAAQNTSARGVFNPDSPPVAGTVTSGSSGVWPGARWPGTSCAAAARPPRRNAGSAPVPPRSQDRSPCGSAS